LRRFASAAGGEGRGSGERKLGGGLGLLLGRLLVVVIGGLLVLVLMGFFGGRRRVVRLLLAVLRRIRLVRGRRGNKDWLAG
jgi:hypothetical protein